MNDFEHQHQCALIKWAKLNEPRHPELRWLFAVPNGGQRSKAVAGKLKASGVKSGVLDLCLPVKRGNFTSLWIEMKYGKNTLTDNQKEFIQFVESQGAKVVVCYDWETATKIIDVYLSHGDKEFVA